jgi:hypothetical protein
VTQAFLDDRFGALLLEMPLGALHLFGKHRTHVVAYIAHADGLEQGDDRLVLEPEITGNLVNAHLRHETSERTWPAAF